MKDDHSNEFLSYVANQTDEERKKWNYQTQRIEELESALKEANERVVARDTELAQLKGYLKDIKEIVLNGRARMTDQLNRTIAERLFDGDWAKSEIEDALESNGVTYAEIGWDDYDNSLEIYGVPSEERLSEQIQKELYKAGFSTIYVNHLNHWETHYNFDLTKDFKFTNGWRISYPHKRNDGTKDILTEDIPPKWPLEWFKTGYARVVKIISGTTAPVGEDEK